MAVCLHLWLEIIREFFYTNSLPLIPLSRKLSFPLLMETSTLQEIKRQQSIDVESSRIPSDRITFLFSDPFFLD